MSAILTIARKAGGGLLSKKISLGADGKPVSDGSPCRIWAGDASRVEITNATDLADKINGLDRSEAIPAATMRQLLAEAIEGFIDPHEMAVIQEAEASERNLLLSLAASIAESQ